MLVGMHDPIERSFLRLLLASRALQTHNDLSLADALFGLEAPDLEVNLERLFLSTALGPPDAADRRLIAELLTRPELPSRDC